MDIDALLATGSDSDLLDPDTLDTHEQLLPIGEQNPQIYGSYIVAMGGGGFSMEPGNTLLDRYILSLANTNRPKVCFVPTASGDSLEYVAKFYRAFNALDTQPCDLMLFQRNIQDLEDFLLSQDIIYVGGGNTANMLAVWRVHGVDKILRKAWEKGVILCGLSAGMNCWFEQSITDSFAGLRPLHDGLAFLEGSCCPHYNDEPLRRPAYEKHVTTEEVDSGYAADSGAALVFEGTSLLQVVSSHPQAGAWRVERSPAGLVVKALALTYLGL